MWKAALAGAVALAMAGSGSVSAQEVTGGVAASHPAVQGAHLLTRADIARFKAAIKLTVEQEQFWPAIDAVLRELAREQAQDPASMGLVARIGSRITSIALTTMAVKRLAAAALPLIRSLDEGQKRDALHFANSVGLGNLAYAF